MNKQQEKLLRKYRRAKPIPHEEWEDVMYLCSLGYMRTGSNLEGTHICAKTTPLGRESIAWLHW